LAVGHDILCVGILALNEARFPKNHRTNHQYRCRTRKYGCGYDDGFRLSDCLVADNGGRRLAVPREVGRSPTPHAHRRHRGTHDGVSPNSSV